jgi:DNA-binding transcriptional MerR regulator
MAGAKPQVTPEQVQEAVEKAGEIDNSQAAGRSTAVGADQRAARRVEILALRLAGFSIEQIASRVNLASSTVHDILMDALSTATNQQVAQMRALENDRLDRAQMAIWPRVVEGDLKAIDAYLKISQQRSRINGLYAPTKIDMRVGIRHEMESALAELERLMDATAHQVIQGEVIRDGTDG